MKEGTSFSTSVKNELARLDLKDQGQMIAELAGVVRLAGSLKLSSFRDLSLVLATENASCARRYLSLLRRVYTDDVGVRVIKTGQVKTKNTYEIQLKDPGTLSLLLDDIAFLRDGNIFSANYKTPASVIRSRDQGRAYIRGAFLGGGSVTDPEKGYHLEFVTGNQDLAGDLVYWLKSLGFSGKITHRKEKQVVYIKEAEEISDLLALMGGGQSVLKFEDVRVVKDLRNYVNRRVNFETANLNKTVKASIRQLENIKFLEEKIGLGKLPSQLQEVAKLRKAYPEASLQEIGSYLDPAVGKSGINHRFKKIDEMANKLRRDIE
ncbi:MAG: DNA-binding protein WhiA [Tissierellia bacterium]|nr:DNA-binding protein WhiA [Tissierellia bacterium]